MATALSPLAGVGTSLKATQPEQTYHNAYLLRFGPDGRCAEFTEFYMLAPSGQSDGGEAAPSGPAWRQVRDGEPPTPRCGGSPEAARRSGRGPDEVTLVVVSKGRSEARSSRSTKRATGISGRIGQRRSPRRRHSFPGDIHWHFVGPLQTNKVRMVRPVTHLLHSLDRERLAAAWVKGPGRPPPVLVEVNIGEEPQKGGVAPDEAW